ncbi:MAG: carbohydrate kinase [Clostridia bacterium]|nr:carbohydrate kinase [Clostridia bacterium]
MKILSFGEIIWDVYPDKKCIGGAPLNFAAHAANEGAEVSLLSAVGYDELGMDALEIIKKHGVDISLVAVKAAYPTGRCTVTLSERGVPSYKIEENTAYDVIPEPEESKLKEFDAFAFGSLALRMENNRQTVRKLLERNIAKEIFVDINLRAPFYSKENVVFCLENATILKISDEELQNVALTAFGEKLDNEAAIERILNEFENIKLLILTCGADGSLAYDTENGDVFRCEPKRVEVVSTVGAGDSYGAAFLVSYLSGKTVPECLRRATEVSADVVSRAEALPVL